MKIICSLASVALMAFSSLSMAQTCAAPTQLTNGASGNTCTGGDGTLGNICSGLGNTGAVAVYSWTYGGTGTPSGNITVTPTAWDTGIAVGEGSQLCGCDGRLL